MGLALQEAAIERDLLARARLQIRRERARARRLHVTSVAQQAAIAVLLDVTESLRVERDTLLDRTYWLESELLRVADARWQRGRA